MPLRGNFTGGRRARGTPYPVPLLFHHASPSPLKSKASESHGSDQKVDSGLISGLSAPRALERQGNLTKANVTSDKAQFPLWPPCGYLCLLQPIGPLVGPHQAVPPSPTGGCRCGCSILDCRRRKWIETMGLTPHGTAPGPALSDSCLGFLGSSRNSL